MKRSLFILLAAVALAAGCGQRSGRSGDAATAKAAADMRDFPTVKIPDVYSETNVRQAYYAEHFWDRFFSEADGMKCDSVTVCGVPATVFEEVFSTYMAARLPDPFSTRLRPGSSRIPGPTHTRSSTE